MRSRRPRRRAHLARLRQAMPGRRRAPLHRIGRGLLRQCDVRKLLRDPRMRAARAPEVPVSCRSTDGRLRVHRGLVQSTTAPLRHRDISHPSTTKGASYPPLAQIHNRPRNRVNSILEVGRWLGRVCNGWLNYFAVPGSGRFIRAFLRRLQRRWMRALRRRSQRARFSWKRLERMTEILWPRASIRHPWPDQRFAVKHPR